MIQLERKWLLGGDRAFDGRSDVIVWLNSLSRDWMPILNLAYPQRIGAPDFLDDIIMLRDQIEHKSTMPESEISLELNSLSDTLPSIDSPFGQAVQFTNRATKGRGLPAAFFVAGFSGDTNFDWSDPANLAGLAAYNYAIAHSADEAKASVAVSNRAREASNEKSIAEGKRKLADALVEALENGSTIRRIASEAEENITGWRSRGDDQIAKSVDALADTQERLSAASESAKSSLDEALHVANETISGFTKAHAEQTRLESASALWKGRYVEHLAKASNARVIAIRTGVIGFFLTFFVLAGAFKGARWLLEYGMNAPEVAKSKGVTDVAPLLRPTFIYELGLTAGVTLAWLTLYIWLLRLIIRSYTTEQHLAIDSSARSALTETYFSLTKDNKAEKEDRAIVLASIFRPVTDGMIKDDGPPAFTPAAILSSLVSSKAGS